MNIISDFIRNYSDLIPLLGIGIMSLLAGGLIIWGVIATGNNIRGIINRENELQRAKRQKEIELMQAQIDYYNNNQKGKGT